MEKPNAGVLAIVGYLMMVMLTKTLRGFVPEVVAYAIPPILLVLAFVGWYFIQRRRRSK